MPRSTIRVTLLLATLVAIRPAHADDAPPFKRLDNFNDEELRKQLLRVPEVGLNQTNAVNLYDIVKKLGTPSNGIPADIGFKLFRKHVALNFSQPEMHELPWRDGPDCQLGQEAAQRLQVLSVNLRQNLRDAVPAGGDIRPDPVKLLEAMTNSPRVDKAEWKTAAALPTMMQMLQTENEPIRELLIDRIADIKGREASEALAQRALFDLSPALRERAVTRLADRPVREYQKTLVDGIRWPWPRVAEHAAEAIAHLNLTSAAAELAATLDQPDPRQPVADKKEKAIVVRELIRINHLSNCMLCHAPSLSTADVVRGRVPHPLEEPQPLYYDAPGGQYVRADTTFVRQNFSVMQPVANSGKWKSIQRYDYVLRTRHATPAEAETLRFVAKSRKTSDYPQREAALFALRELTGTDVGTDANRWMAAVKALDKR